MASLYETDTCAWAFEQARRLRAGEALDAENLAEEIEDLGKQQRQTLVSNLEVLLMHKLKRDFQPDKRTKSWRYTTKEHANRIVALLQRNPSLCPYQDELLLEAYENGRLKAAAETDLDLEAFPIECPYSGNEILSVL